MRADVSLTAADVQFLNDPSGEPNRVKVDVYRRAVARQPALDDDRAVLRHADRRHRRDRDGGSRAGERRDLPDAVHDSGSLERNARRPRGTRSTTISTRSRQGRPARPLPTSMSGRTTRRTTRATTRCATRACGSSSRPTTDPSSRPACISLWRYRRRQPAGPTTYRLGHQPAASRVTSWATATRSFTSPGCSRGRSRRASQDLVASDPDAYWDTEQERGRLPLEGDRARASGDPAVRPVLLRHGKLPADATPACKFVNYLGFFIEGHRRATRSYGRITPVGGLAT